MLFFHGNDYSAVYCEIAPLLGSLNSVDSLNWRESAFLHGAERQALNKIAAENYRRSWLAARICAKYLWAAPKEKGGIEAGAIAWTTLNVVSRNDKGQGIRPILYEREQRIDRELSISHTDDAVFVVLANRSGCRVGCDLVPLGSITSNMVQLFFRDGENLPTDPHQADRCWAIKEAAYKAGNDGRAFAPAAWQITQQHETDANAFFCRDASAENGIEIPVETFLHGQHAVAIAAVR